MLAPLPVVLCRESRVLTIGEVKSKDREAALRCACVYRYCFGTTKIATGRAIESVDIMFHPLSCQRKRVDGRDFISSCEKGKVHRH